MHVVLVVTWKCSIDKEIIAFLNSVQFRNFVSSASQHKNLNLILLTIKHIVTLYRLLCLLLRNLSL